MSPSARAVPGSSTVDGGSVPGRVGASGSQARKTSAESVSARARVARALVALSWVTTVALLGFDFATTRASAQPFGDVRVQEETPRSDRNRLLERECLPGARPLQARRDVRT